MGFVPGPSDILRDTDDRSQRRQKPGGGHDASLSNEIGSNERRRQRADRAPSTRDRAAVRGHVQVVVFDVQGKHVRSLRDQVMDAGEHSVAWDLRDDQGREAPRGVYFLKAWALGMVTRARLVVLDRRGVV